MYPEKKKQLKTKQECIFFIRRDMALQLSGTIHLTGNVLLVDNKLPSGSESNFI